MNRVIAYIDGFNVYHSLDQVQPYHKYKWIDYWQLASCFVGSSLFQVGSSYWSLPATR